MEHLSDQVEIHAPREWGDLCKAAIRRSSRTAGRCTTGPRRPPGSPRQELKAKSRAILRARLAAGLTVYFFKHGKLIRIPGKNEAHALRGRL